jgi:hypothetical protein
VNRRAKRAKISALAASAIARSATLGGSTILPSTNRYCDVCKEIIDTDGSHALSYSHLEVVEKKRKREEQKKKEHELAEEKKRLEKEAQEEKKRLKKEAQKEMDKKERGHGCFGCQETLPRRRWGKKQLELQIYVRRCIECNQNELRKYKAPK